MRQITFRGKSKKDGRWVYGSLVYGTLGGKETPAEEVVYIGELVDGEFRGEEVYLGTVGQYTGVATTDGKPVYEGDIIEWKRGWVYNFTWAGGIQTQSERQAKETAWTHIGKVEFKEGEFCFNVDIPICAVKAGRWQYVSKSIASETHYIVFDFKIIGNIHDNPELLEAPNENEAIGG